MVSGDVTLDTSTGLQWARMIDCPVPYDTAVSTCTTWGGRLPTEAELQAIITPVLMCVVSGMLTWAFPAQGQTMWTSTVDPMNSAFHYTLYFNSNSPVSAPDGDGHWVQCVK
jgi:hypothetical protein